MPIKAIVFDFDGTLVDSLGVKYQARFDLFDQDPAHVQAAAKELIPQIRGKLRGEIIREILEQAHQGSLSPEALEQKVAEYVGRYDALVEDRIVSQGTFPGARELLEELNPRYRLFVNSGTPHYALERLLGRLGLSHLFHGIHGIDPSRKDGAAVMKTENLEKILRSVAASGDEALVVGDGMEDLWSAQAHGCRFAGIGSERNGWGESEDFPVMPSVADLARVAYLSDEHGPSA